MENFNADYSLVKDFLELKRDYGIDIKTIQDVLLNHKNAVISLGESVKNNTKNIEILCDAHNRSAKLLSIVTISLGVLGYKYVKSNAKKDKKLKELSDKIDELEEKMGNLCDKNDTSCDKNGEEIDFFED